MNLNKERDVEWEFEADMFAASSENLQLCMKAVWALFWKQTADERLASSRRSPISKCLANVILSVLRCRSLISDLDGGCSSSSGLFLGCFEIGRVYFPFCCCRCYLPLGYAHCNLIRCILSDMGEDKTIMDLVLESKNACGRTQVVVKLPMMMVLCIVGLPFAKLRYLASILAERA